MNRWRFNFGQFNDFDGLVCKCLNSVPQYRQVYSAPRADVSHSLEQMITKGFPQHQNIVWHKKTHGQKRYYWIRKSNGNDEVCVKVGGGIFGKAERDLRILTSTNECRKVVRQFLVRWDKSGFLPGWKTVWTIFDAANYDVSERRIKVIHKIIQGNITRESFDDDDTADFDIESISDRSSYRNHTGDDNHANGSVSGIDQDDNSCDVQQPSLSNQLHHDQTVMKSPPGLRQSLPSNISGSTTNHEN